MRGAQTAETESAQSSLKVILSRLNLLIEHETAAIGADRSFDYQASNERKSRLLYELNRLNKSLGSTLVDEDLVQDLSKLKDALQRNEAKIGAHLSAVREVSDIMVSILQNDEADGTYSELS